MKKISVWSRRPPEPLFFAWRADPIWLEPESAPGPRTSGAGAAKKSGGSATLFLVIEMFCDGMCIDGMFSDWEF